MGLRYCINNRRKCRAVTAMCWPEFPEKEVSKCPCGGFVVFHCDHFERFQDHLMPQSKYRKGISLLTEIAQHE
jgi:hypothetical protein